MSSVSLPPVVVKSEQHCLLGSTSWSNGQSVKRGPPLHVPNQHGQTVKRSNYYTQLQECRCQWVQAQSESQVQHCYRGSTAPVKHTSQALYLSVHRIQDLGGQIKALAAAGLPVQVSQPALCCPSDLSNRVKVCKLCVCDLPAAYANCWEDSLHSKFWFTASVNAANSQCSDYTL